MKLIHLLSKRGRSLLLFNRLSDMDSFKIAKRKLIIRSYQRLTNICCFSHSTGPYFSYDGLALKPVLLSTKMGYYCYYYFLPSWLCERNLENYEDAPNPEALNSKDFPRLKLRILIFFK